MEYLNWTKNLSLLEKVNQLKLFIISTFNLDDSVIEAESYVKKVTQP